MFIHHAYCRLNHCISWLGYIFVKNKNAQIIIVHVRMGFSMVNIEIFNQKTAF